MATPRTDKWSIDSSRVELVAIGASAGGVEALATLLPALPAQFQLPVVVVVHLPPGKPSLLPEVLGQYCALKLREVEDKEPIEPGVVYCAPPDYHLLFDDRRTFALSVDDRVQFSRPSIDVAFESAVQVFGPRVLGLLLTGANSDGAAGLCSIRAAGGVTAIQDPAEAMSPEMPLSVLRRCQPDFTLPLARMASLLQAVGMRGAA